MQIRPAVGLSSAPLLSMLECGWHTKGEIVSGEKPVCIGRTVAFREAMPCAVLFSHLERSVHGCNFNAFCLLLSDM